MLALSHTDGETSREPRITGFRKRRERKGQLIYAGALQTTSLHPREREGSPPPVHLRLVRVQAKDKRFDGLRDTGGPSRWFALGGCLFTWLQYYYCRRRRRARDLACKQCTTIQ